MRELHKAITDIDIFSPPEIYVERILQRICDNLGYRFGTVIEIDEEGKGRMFASYNLPEDYVERVNRVKAQVLSSPSGEAIGTRKVVVVHNPLSEPRLAPWYDVLRPYNFKTIVWVPLLSKGHAYGNYVLYDMQIRDITEAELHALEQIGVMVSIAISSNQYLDQLNQKTKELEEEISERKRVEEKLRLFSQAADSSIDGVAMGNLEGRITYVNETFVRMFGYSREELIGREIAFIYAEDQIPRLEEAIKATMEGGWTGELVGKRKNGELFPMMVSSSRVLDDEGKVIAHMANHRDITERKQADEERERLLKELETKNTELQKAMEHMADLEEITRMKTEFLSITSHELRTPLTPMKAQLQMLQEGYMGKLNEKQEQSIEVVLRNLSRLDKLVKDILDISRIEAGRIKLTFESMSINGTIKEAIKMQESFAKEKNIKISAKLAAMPNIIGDAERLRQAIGNLLNNAIKFSEKSGEVIIETERLGENVQFSITDYGIGISKANQKKLFKPFSQIDSSMGREHAGTGLGLAIAKGIIQAHNGNVWAESELGKGSTFYFSIPTKQKIAEKEALYIG